MDETPFGITGRNIMKQDTLDALRAFFESDQSMAEIKREFGLSVESNNFEDWVARISEFEAQDDLFEKE